MKRRDYIYKQVRTNENRISLLSSTLWWSYGTVILEQEGTVSWEVQARPVWNRAQETQNRPLCSASDPGSKMLKKRQGPLEPHTVGNQREIWERSSHQSVNVLAVSFNVQFQKPGGRIGDYVGIWSLEILAYFYWHQWYLKAISVNFLKYVFSQRMELSVGLVNYIGR